MLFASCAISVSDVTTGTKMEAFFRIRTKSGKKKIYGLKWKSPKNVRTKSGFLPKKNTHTFTLVHGFFFFFIIYDPSTCCFLRMLLYACS